MGLVDFEAHCLDNRRRSFGEYASVLRDVDDGMVEAGEHCHDDSDHPDDHRGLLLGLTEACTQSASQNGNDQVVPLVLVLEAQLELDCLDNNH